MSNSVNSVNSVNSFNCVNSVNNVNSVNSYSAVLPPSPMVFFLLKTMKMAFFIGKRIADLKLCCHCCLFDDDVSFEESFCDEDEEYKEDNDEQRKVIIKIPSEMEVAPCYNCWHC